MQARSGVSGAGYGCGRWSGRVPRVGSDLPRGKRKGCSRHGLMGRVPRAAVLQGVGGLAAIRGIGSALVLPCLLVVGALLLAGERGFTRG